MVFAFPHGPDVLPELRAGPAFGAERDHAGAVDMQEARIKARRRGRHAGLVRDVGALQVSRAEVLAAMRDAGVVG